MCTITTPHPAALLWLPDTDPRWPEGGVESATWGNLVLYVAATPPDCCGRYGGPWAAWLVLADGGQLRDVWDAAGLADEGEAKASAFNAFRRYRQGKLTPRNTSVPDMRTPW